MHLVYFLEDLSRKSIKVFPVHIFSGMHKNNSNKEFIDMCLTTATTTLDIHNFAVLTTNENAQLISNVVGILFVPLSMLTVKSKALFEGEGIIFIWNDKALGINKIEIEHL